MCHVQCIVARWTARFVAEITGFLASVANHPLDPILFRWLSRAWPLAFSSSRACPSWRSLSPVLLYLSSFVYDRNESRRSSTFRPNHHQPIFVRLEHDRIRNMLFSDHRSLCSFYGCPVTASGAKCTNEREGCSFVWISIVDAAIHGERKFAVQTKSERFYGWK